MRILLRSLGLLIVLTLPASASVDAAAQMIREKFADYHSGDWKAWKSRYADDAVIFYNSADTSMTVDEAVAGHVQSIVPLSHYEFREEETRVNAVLDHNGNVWVHFNGIWRATFSSTGESIAVPTSVEYLIVDGKIVEERGYWNNQIMVGPYTRAFEATEAQNTE